jgi:hypothetical protein
MSPGFTKEMPFKKLNTSFSWLFHGKSIVFIRIVSLFYTSRWQEIYLFNTIVIIFRIAHFSHTLPQSVAPRHLAKVLSIILIYFIWPHEYDLPSTPCISHPMNPCVSLLMKEKTFTSVYLHIQHRTLSWSDVWGFPLTQSNSPRVHLVVP